eukprot:1474074-Rhodomonas_salina.6
MQGGAYRKQLDFTARGVHDGEEGGPGRAGGDACTVSDEGGSRGLKSVEIKSKNHNPSTVCTRNEFSLHLISHRTMHWGCAACAACAARRQGVCRAVCTPHQSTPTPVHQDSGEKEGT